MIDQLYLETLLEEAKNPQNVGYLDEPDYSYTSVNAHCGDQVTVELQFDTEHRILAVAWQGSGCVISQAAMSVLSEEIRGKTLEEINQIREKEMLELLGLEQIAMGRNKCLMLGVQSIQQITNNYKA